MKKTEFTEKQKKTRKIGCLSLVAIFVFISLVSMCADQMEFPVAKTDHSLTENFNKKAAKRNLPYRAEIKDQKESVAEFSVSDTSSAGFVGTKDGKEVTSVLFIGAGDGSVQSGIDQLLVLSLLVETVDDSMSDEDRSKLIAILAKAVDNPGVSFNQENGRFSYSSVYREKIGWWVTID